MILLWGLETDSPLAAVRAQLDRMGVPVLFVDQRNVLASRISGDQLQLGSRVVDLTAVTAAYLRPYDSRQLPAVARAGPGSAAWEHALSFDERLWTWAEMTPALAVNRGSAMAHNGSKAYQSRHVRSVGFLVPETLLTTDPAAVLAFAAEHREVVYKSMSAIRSVVARLRAADVERLQDVTSCPTQFQAYVPGIDYRVHVVGESVFCCRIDCDADDYRYAARQDLGVQRSVVVLSAELGERCRALARLEGLHVAGIDLRRNHAGEWYCFEANPSPAFTYYDGPGQPIARAIAALLARRA